MVKKISGVFWRMGEGRLLGRGSGSIASAVHQVQVGPCRQELHGTPCNTKVTYTPSHEVTGMRGSLKYWQTLKSENAVGISVIFFKKIITFFLLFVALAMQFHVAVHLIETKSVPGCTRFLVQLRTGLAFGLLPLKSFLVFVTSLCILCVKIRV